MWVRHVVVPGLTDQEVHLAALRRYVDTLPNVQRVELLPFHKLGAEKYRGWAARIPWRRFPPWIRSGAASFRNTGFPTLTGEIDIK